MVLNIIFYAFIGQLIVKLKQVTRREKGMICNKDPQVELNMGVSGYVACVATNRLPGHSVML